MSDDGPGRTIVASFYPLAFAAEQVAEPGDRVTNITPPGVEPHDYELSVSDVETIRDADVVVYVSGGFQPAVDDAVRRARGRVVDVEPARGHGWLNPRRYAEILELTAEALGDARAAEAPARRARELAKDYLTTLEVCERHTIVTTHAAFGELEAFGVAQIPIAGTAPEAEPTPQDLKRVVERARRAGVTAVFTEPLVSSRLADTVAREIGAEVATLDPLESEPEDGDYFGVMRENLAALRKALGCR